MKHSDMNTPRQTKADLAYTQLRKNILTGKLQPGSMLLENKLCDEFNISRTPIRTALQRLVYENFVDYIPEKGMFVSQIKFIDILEIAEVRIPLECLAVRLATARMTDEDLNELGNSLAQHRAAMEADDAEAVFEHDNDFHRFIAKGSKNDKLYAICLGNLG